MTAIKTLIVDDEELARRRLKTLLREDREIKIVGECKNAAEAIHTVRAHQPSPMFLDVQMPGINGFAVLQALEQHERPLTIFVTAYDEYAIKAFDFHALDYLLKPFNRSRFQKALRGKRPPPARNICCANRWPK
ncbi:MAG: LytR/AlgR family response regulator transcription factor [bacterium]